MISSDRSSTLAYESGKQPVTGALTASDCKSPYALSVTTWGPVERGRRVDAARDAA